MLLFFIVGAGLLVVPLALVLMWDGPACSGALYNFVETSYVCIPTRLLKTLTSFFPFVMVIGAVLIGYNLKKISDSNLPPKEEDEENLEDEEEDA